MFTKNSRNKYDKKDSLELGRKSEDVFVRTAKFFGWSVQVASEENNINDHFDYEISKENEFYKVEVNSVKRVSQSDKELQENLIWIELHGVRPNDRGWLFGKADLIAFELFKSFRIVKRVELVSMVNKIVDFKAKAIKPHEALYKVYSRPGRIDLLTLIQADRLENITWAEWVKP